MKFPYKKKDYPLKNVSYIELPVDADSIVKLLDEIKKKQQPVEEVPVMEEAMTFSLKQKKVIYLMRKNYTIHKMAMILDCTDGSINDMIRRLKDKVGVEKRSDLLEITAGIKF